jgi:hypothetical protein
MRLVLLMTCLVALVGCNREVPIKTPDRYAEHYVPVKMMEGSLDGAIDGMKVIKGFTGWTWSKGPIRSTYRGPDVAYNPKVRYATILTYTVAVRKEVWNQYVAKGGKESDFYDEATAFVREFEMNDLKLKMSQMDIHVEFRHELRNNFYERMNGRIATKLGQEPPQRNIVKLRYDRHTPPFEEVKPEQAARLIQEVE